jgi:hypothetical protein
MNLQSSHNLSNLAIANPRGVAGPRVRTSPTTITKPAVDRPTGRSPVPGGSRSNFEIGNRCSRRSPDLFLL